MLRRHGLTDAWRIDQARRWCPVRYVLFDLLYHAGRWSAQVADASIVTGTNPALSPRRPPGV
jgi:hypothetical protein